MKCGTGGRSDTWSHAPSVLPFRGMPPPPPLPFLPRHHPLQHSLPADDPLASDARSIFHIPYIDMKNVHIKGYKQGTQKGGIENATLKQDKKKKGSRPRRPACAEGAWPLPIGRSQLVQVAQSHFAQQQQALVLRAAAGSANGNKGRRGEGRTRN